MTKKLNTKKVNQGHSVTLATACKKAITRTCRLYKNADTKIATSYDVNGETYELALCMVKLMDASKAKTLTAYLKKVIGADKLEAYGYGNNDFSALIKFGRDIQNKDHQKWVDVQGDGVGRKPQGVLKRLKEQGNGTNTRTTGDVDKWIASIIPSAIKRGISIEKLFTKLTVHAGDKVKVKKTNDPVEVSLFSELLRTNGDTCRKFLSENTVYTFNANNVLKPQFENGNLKRNKK